MGFVVIVQTATDFDRWLARTQLAPLGARRRKPPPRARPCSSAQACAGCHTDPRHAGARARSAPTSPTSASAATIGADTRRRTRPTNLRAWITDAQHVQARRARCRRSQLSGARPRRTSSPTSRACSSEHDRRTADADDRDRSSDLERALARRARASRASSRPSTTSASASATSTRRSCSSSSPGSPRWSCAIQLASAEQQRARARDVQRALHDARHDDDLPVQHARARRLRQLPRSRCRSAAATWRSRGSTRSATGSSCSPGCSCTRASLVGHPPDGGWFAYVPLTGKAYSPGINIDFWGLGDHLRRHLDDGRRGQLHRHDLQDPRAGHDASTACRSSCGRCSCSRSW